MSEQPAVLRISEPGEVAQVVPHLLGFQPEESLVILVLEQGRIQVTARIDIDAAQPPGEAEHLLDRIWSRFPDADAVAIAYTNQPRSGWDLLHRCETHLGPSADTTLMLVTGEVWHTPDGQSGTVDRYGPLAAEAALQGLPVLPSRAELDARFASATITPDLLAQVEPALAGLPAHDDTPALIRLATDLINHNLPSPNPGPTSRIDTPAALQLAVVTQNPAVRDLALLSMTGNNADQHLRLWRDVVNQTPNVIAEAPLFLAGMAAWLTGDGASAVVALERSQAAARAERQVSGLLDALIDQVVPPSAWPDVREQILHHAEPQVRDTLTRRDTNQQPLWETVDRPEVRRPPNPTLRGRKPPAPGIAI